MRKFKTICHNNQYKDCGVTPEQRDRESGGFLIADSRPTNSGTLMQFKMGRTATTIGISSEKIPLEVGKEYDVAYDGSGYSIVDTEGSLIYLMTEDEKMISLYSEESIMGIRFSDFFYTEEQLRDNKINKILD